MIFHHIVCFNRSVDLTTSVASQAASPCPQYHPYIVERDGKTLLPQFLGMYR